MLCHLLLFDQGLQNVLAHPRAARLAFDAVPVVRHDGHPHDLSATVNRVLRDFGIEAWPIHDASAAGLSDHAYSARIVNVECCRPSVVLRGDCFWLPVAHATREDGLDSPQRQVLLSCLERLRSPSELFDSNVNVVRAEEWAGDRLTEYCGLANTGPVQAVKHSRFRRVVKWSTASGQFYLKVHGNVRLEAEATSVLGGLCPRRFPQTIAIDREHGYWFYKGLAGQRLSANEITTLMAVRVGEAIASIQRSTVGSSDLMEVLQSYTISGRTLTETVSLARVLCRRHTKNTSSGAIPASTWEYAAACCERLDRLPSAFIHGDLWPGNMVKQRGGPGFIDLESACFGPAPLMLSDLFEHLRETGAPGSTETIAEAYVEVWRGRKLRDELRRAITEVAVTGKVFALNAWWVRHGISLQAVANGTLNLDQMQTQHVVQAPRLSALLSTLEGLDQNRSVRL